MMRRYEEAARRSAELLGEKRIAEFEVGLMRGDMEAAEREVEEIRGRLQEAVRELMDVAGEALDQAGQN